MSTEDRNDPPHSPSHSEEVAEKKSRINSQIWFIVAAESHEDEVEKKTFENIFVK